MTLRREPVGTLKSADLHIFKICYNEKTIE
jgi:hypothetical protein